jgi:solute carrier family 25 folate transporter 32
MGYVFISQSSRPADIPTHFADGLSSIARAEGISGLFRGTSLALFGVSNGAIQFMAYEEMKRWGFRRKRKLFEVTGRTWTPAEDKLVSSRTCSELPQLSAM